MYIKTKEGEVLLVHQYTHPDLIITSLGVYQIGNSCEWHTPETKPAEDSIKGLEEEAVVHELKVWPQYMDDILSGEKTFELRKLDRLFGKGNILYLREWSPIEWQESGGYSGRECRRIITYRIIGGQWGLSEDYCILGIKPVRSEADGWKAIAESNRDANEEACKMVWALREENKQLKSQLDRKEPPETKEGEVSWQNLPQDELNIINEISLTIAEWITPPYKRALHNDINNAAKSVYDKFVKTKEGGVLEVEEVHQQAFEAGKQAMLDFINAPKKEVFPTDEESEVTEAKDNTI